MKHNPDAPIRVLHVIQRMEAGGSQAFLMNLYRRIDRRVLQFDFLVEYSDRQFYDDEIEALGGRIFRTNVRIDKNLFKFKKFLGNFFREHPEYSIVHCHVYTIGYFVLKAADKAGVPVRIAHAHENSMSGWMKPFKVVMKALFPLHANRFFACSGEAGSFLFGDRPCLIAKNAIDVNRFAFDAQIGTIVRKELGLLDSFVVGTVGRLHPQKNQLFLLDVFKELLSVDSNAKLLIVGDGPLHSKILSRAEALGISHQVTLLGNRNDVDRLYQAMDVFVLPSIYEGLGIVAIEAQCSGLPTVCSDGVAREADVSPLFRRLALNAGKEVWADLIYALRFGRKPNLGINGVRNHDFDIKNNAIKMQNWYIGESQSASDA